MTVIDFRKVNNLKQELKELPSLIEEVREFKLRIARYNNYLAIRVLFEDALEAQIRLENRLHKCREEYAEATDIKRG